MKKFIYTISALVLLFGLFIPMLSYAAEISLDIEKDSIATSEEFVVKVFLDTESVQVNAVEGVVVFSGANLEFIESLDGNSAVNFWIEKPHLSKVGEVSFSGITAGGFAGDKMFLFSVVFRSPNGGDGVLKFKNIRVLENDGIGTEVLTKNQPLRFTISKEINTNDNNLDMVIDKNRPEDFDPVVSSDISIWEGKHFVVFSTVDKGVGMDHYEVKEGFWGEYVVSDSPYLLKDQSLDKNIYIKAIDKNGNERVVKIKSEHFPGLELSIILGIILTICIWYRKKILKFF